MEVAGVLAAAAPLGMPSGKIEHHPGWKPLQGSAAIMSQAGLQARAGSPDPLRGTCKSPSGSHRRDCNERSSTFKRERTGRLKLAGHVDSPSCSLGSPGGLGVSAAVETNAPHSSCVLNVV